MKRKQLKVSLGGPRVSINFTLAEQSGGHAGGEVGLKEKPHWSLSNSIPPLPLLLLFLQHVRNLCPPPAPEGAGKVSLGVFYTTAASPLAEGLHWLSTASLKGTWQISRRRKKKNTGGEGEKGGEKSILSSHAPLGAKATSGILKDARVDRI